MPDPPRRRPKPAARAAKPATRAAAKPAVRAAKPAPRAATKPAARKKPTASPRPPREAKAPDPGRRRAAVRGALLSVLLVGVLFAFVYPTQTFLDQRDATAKAREQLDVLRSEDTKLAAAAERLQNDGEIARIAREFYGLVKPGEQPFVILPAPTTTTAPPPPVSSGVAKPTP